MAWYSTPELGALISFYKFKALSHFSFFNLYLANVERGNLGASEGF